MISFCLACFESCFEFSQRLGRGGSVVCAVEQQSLRQRLMNYSKRGALHVNSPMLWLSASAL